MKFELGTIFNLGEKRFMVAEAVLYMGVDYLLLNKLDETEEPTEEMFVYEVDEEGLILVDEEEVLELLLPIFENKLKKDINKAQIEEKYNIN